MVSLFRVVRFLALCCLLILMFLGAVALGAQSQRDMTKEKAIWDQLQAIAPSAVGTFQAATNDMDNDDYQAAELKFQEVLQKAPHFEAAERRLAISLTYTGMPDEGKQMLESLVKKHPSPENLGTLAQALAYPGNKGQSTPDEKQRALALATQAFHLDGGKDEYYAMLVAQLSLDLDRDSQFREAVDTLAKNHPDLMQTHYFKAIEAAMDEKWSKAEDEIRRAEALGLPHEAAEEFLASGIESRARVWRYAYYSLYTVAAWAIGLVLLFVVGKLLSGLTLRSIETDDPNVSDGGRHGLIRKLYRVLINLAAVYYYISIPVVIFLLLAVAGSITYGFWMAGEIPVKLLAILVVGTLVTAFKMVQSLFVRRESSDPGRAISVNEAPGLWNLAKEVSNAVGTRTVDQIRLTPGTDLAVYENGSWKQRSEDRGKRVLLVGAGILNGFRTNAFRAVLAHEYGHLSHRDTAGGEVALRVNANMTHFAIAMVRAGQAVWWNLGFWFLRIYHFIFRRLSHGATRLQEVLADRVAVLNYGAKAFEEGLRHAVRRAVEFEEAANWEIREANQTRRAIRNLYDLDSSAPIKVDDKAREAMTRPTTEDDTHPAPLDRFRYASRIVSKPAIELDGMVWDLFVNREALTTEMSAMIEKRRRATLS